MASIPRNTLHRRDGASLLSPTFQDDDASSIHSAGDRSDQDTDSEDDEVLLGARTSADIRAHDRGVLLEEEERDSLLEQSRRRGRRGSALAVVEPLKKLFTKSYAELPGLGSSSSKIVDEKENKEQRREHRRQRRRNRKNKLMTDAEHGEDGQLMYEMEEGGLKEGSATGESSDTEGSELDRQGLLGIQIEKAQKRKKWQIWCFLHLLIALGFSILVLIAWKLSRHRGKGYVPVQPMLNNGTALFAPTTILISLDGFRADFVKRGITPRLNAFIQEGISPPYMLPSFPSVTFPNHYTLATGLYPESHGIVGNTFWDPELKEEFYYTNPLAMQSKWWGGEPIWVTAERHGIRSAIHMWPGSEAHIMDIEPSFLDKYNGNEPLKKKVSRILDLLDKPGLENELAEVVTMRPQLIAAYVPNVDGDGHRYGPNSTEIRATISDVDTMLDQLFLGLEARNLTNIVNVVIVSDHGMATTDTNRLIQLEDIIDTDLVEHMDGWPLYGLRPKDPTHLHDLYNTLSEEAATNPNFEVYLRDENMPERYHFSKNERIAPLWVVPKTGWAIVTKKEFDVADGKAKGVQYNPRGLHGYDHEHPLMRAIFVARGPAFPHAGNSRVKPFQNIEVYNIVCDSLNLPPNSNNGTIRLPFQPVGLHTPGTSPDEPHDPEPSDSPTPASTDEDSLANIIISISPIEASSAADPNVVPPHLVGVDPTDPAPVGVDPADQPPMSRPVVDDEGKTNDDESDFLAWLKGKLDGIKDWLGGFSGAKEEEKGIDTGSS